MIVSFSNLMMMLVLLFGIASMVLNLMFHEIVIKNAILFMNIMSTHRVISQYWLSSVGGATLIDESTTGEF